MPVYARQEQILFISMMVLEENFRKHIRRWKWRLWI